MTTAFTITFAEWFPHDADTRGYFPDDYLPGFRDMRFQSHDDAHDWMNEYYLGPDPLGVQPLFHITEIER